MNPATLESPISMLRGKFKVMFGDGGKEDLVRAIRGQGNFIEYIPLALLLVGMVEWQGMRPWVVHTLAGALFAARVFHYWGLTARQDAGRGIGTTVTWAVLVVAGLIVLYRSWAG